MDVGDNNFSKAGNESQMAPLFWAHVPASQLLKLSVGKRKTGGRCREGTSEVPEPTAGFKTRREGSRGGAAGSHQKMDPPRDM